MDIDFLKAAGLVLSTAITVSGGAWEIARRTKVKLATTIQDWQLNMVRQEREWRVTCENERYKDAKECEARIDALRDKIDQVRDQYDKLAEKNSNLRVELHDLVGEVKAWRQTQKPGGRRFLDPPTDKTPGASGPKS